MTLTPEEAVLLFKLAGGKEENFRAICDFIDSLSRGTSTSEKRSASMKRQWDRRKKAEEQEPEP